MPEPLPSNVAHDPQVLRAITHPVRNRILSELDAQGSLRAADIARELDIPANQASFHLRQLAKYGLVEEDPDAARDRRDRVWRATGTVNIDIEDLQAGPGGPAAARVFRRNAASWGHHVVASAYAEKREPGIHRSVTDSALRLTAAEAGVLTEELLQVVERWSERTRLDTGDGAGDDSGEARRTYLYFATLQPYPERPGGTP
ncbi:helix-turn-helix domain-containing protein [Nocardioides sp. 1609]|uniref:winged helix-turn-helix domain-containing protein n=1 Tax=Nocardioides sp. 1609 TaxID=2508327 RepID=UPI00106F5A56|nr:helix-turn-helix domain-containing protein [Nocardioides sp. 1609]